MVPTGERGISGIVLAGSGASYLWLGRVLTQEEHLKNDLVRNPRGTFASFQRRLEEFPAYSGPNKSREGHRLATFSGTSVEISISDNKISFIFDNLDAGKFVGMCKAGIISEEDLSRCFSSTPVRERLIIDADLMAGDNGYKHTIKLSTKVDRFDACVRSYVDAVDCMGHELRKQGMTKDDLKVAMGRINRRTLAHIVCGLKPIKEPKKTAATVFVAGDIKSRSREDGRNGSSGSVALNQAFAQIEQELRADCNGKPSKDGKSRTVTLSEDADRKRYAVQQHQRKSQREQKKKK